MTPVVPRLIEELTLNAWPPLQTLLFDGWSLGFSDGYTRRANSVQPLYASTLPLDEKIATCEALYSGRQRPITYKITSALPDGALDGLLEQAGYVSAALTSVQVAELGGRFENDPAVLISESLSEDWFAALNALAFTPPALQSTERRLLDKIVPPHCFASLTLDGQTVAVGLAVAERGYVGLFDIVVDTRVRNQGLGRRVCGSLLAWGERQSAHTAYLAVMVDNAPARHLYDQLGFHEVYAYWYRHRPAA